MTHPSLIKEILEDIFHNSNIDIKHADLISSSLLKAYEEGRDSIGDGFVIADKTLKNGLIGEYKEPDVKTNE